jgi:insulysin
MPVGDSVSDKPAFLPGDWNRYLMQTPVKDIKEFTFSWVIPYQADLWRTKPTAYITHLLGHEGTGSMAAALKDLGLISGCYVGNGAWLEGAFSLLNINFDLTDEGLNQLDVIGQHLFAYLGMLQASPPEKRIFDEMAKLSETQFKFASDGQAFDMCPNIALGIVKGLPPSEALAGGSMLYEYDPAAISSLLAQLTLDTVRVGHQAKCLADRCTDKDSSYESPLKYEEIPAEWLQSWTGALGRAEELGLQLPKENPFVPEDLSLKPLPEGGSPKEPVRLQCTNLQPVSVMYHRQDDTFKQPKATVSFTIYTPFPMSSVENQVRAEMWCYIVSEALNEFAYDAAMAGVNYSLGLQSGAIGLSVGGFNDKLSVLLDAVMEKMRSMVEAPEMIYNICADAYLDEIRNMAFRSQPYNQCTMRFNELTARGSVFPSYKKYEAFQNMKREDLNDMCSKLFEQCHVEVLSTGNIFAEEVQSLSSSLVKGLQLKEPLAVLPEKAEAALPKGSTIWTLPSTDEDSPNHAVFTRIQLPDSEQTDMMLNLVSAILSSKYFDELRTKQQLGYIVGMNNSRSSKFNYLVAVVQTEFPPDYVRAQINDFLDQHFKFIEETLDEEEFNTCLQGLLSDLKMKPQNLSEEFSRFAGPFAERTYDFGRRQRSIDFVESDACSLDALRTFVKEELKSAPRMYSQVNKVLAKEDKPLPEGSKIPADPDSLRKWTKHQEIVEEFQKSAEWMVLNNRVEA